MTSTGNGQKLCRLLKRTSPASNIFWIPGMSEMRMPWPSSIESNPSLPLISRSISSPAVWRPEFQQVENEIMIAPNECSRHRRQLRFGHGRNRTVAHVASGEAQNIERGDSIDHRGNGQRSAHADQIGKSGDDETGDWHQAKKTQAEDCGDAAAKMRRRVLLHDRIGQAEVHGECNREYTHRAGCEKKAVRTRHKKNARCHGQNIAAHEF